jgi:ankyrin repeat protein
MTLLHRACIEENFEAVDLITSQFKGEALSKVINENENEDGWTPLLWST